MHIDIGPRDIFSSTIVCLPLCANNFMPLSCWQILMYVGQQTPSVIRSWTLRCHCRLFTHCQRLHFGFKWVSPWRTLYLLADLVDVDYSYVVGYRVWCMEHSIACLGIESSVRSVFGTQWSVTGRCCLRVHFLTEFDVQAKLSRPSTTGHCRMLRLALILELQHWVQNLSCFQILPISWSFCLPC